MARIHARSFPTHPRPWSEAEFTSLLVSPGIFTITLDQGFLIGRVVLDEAELLTISVDPALRRQGTARRLMSRFDEDARAFQATGAYLEVASDNLPAQALYRVTGWSEVGRRRNYYAPSIDALVLFRELGGHKPS